MSQKNKNKKNISSSLSFETPSSPTWLAWLSVGWFVFVIYQYLQVNPIGPVLDQVHRWWPPAMPTLAVLKNNLFSLLIFLGILSGAYGLGHAVMRFFASSSHCGKLVLSCSLGLGFLGLVNLILGAAQLISTRFLLGAWVILAAYGIWRLKKEGSDFYIGLKKEFKVILKESNVFMLILLGIILGVGLLMSFVPELFYDALVYHLGAPRFYWQEGGIKFFPNLHFNYPLNIQMVYMSGLALGGESSAKLVHWGMAVLLALGFFAWSQESKRSNVGVWAALFFLSIPMVQMNMWTTGIDVGLSLFALLTAWCWIKGFFPLAGLFSGLCFASKLTGSLVTPALLMIHILSGWMEKKEFKLIMKEVFLMGGLASCVALPWMIKAYVYTGNPVFPFLGQIFGGLDADRTSRFFGESQGVTPTTIWGWLTLFWGVTFKSMSGLSFMGPFFIALFPLSLVSLVVNKQIPSKIRWVFLMGLLGIIALSFVNRLTRYWLPFISVSMLAMSWISYEVFEKRSFPRICAMGLFSFFGFVNILHSFNISFGSYMPWNVLLGKESIVEYQSYTHPGLNPYPSINISEWARKNLPPDSKLLVLGDEKVGNMNIRYFASGVYDRPILSTWLKQVSGADGLKNILNQNQITHILVNPLEGKRLLGYGIAEYSESDLAQIAQFWDLYVRPLYRSAIPEKQGGQPPLYLYEILNEPQVPQQAFFWNPILWWYEENLFPSESLRVYNDGLTSTDSLGTINKKIALYKELLQKTPDISAYQRRLQELSMAQRALIQK